MSDAHDGAFEPWKTAISDADGPSIRFRGYDITQLMSQATFADTVFLLHQGRLPTEGERRLIDSILIGAADHGPGSPSAAAARIVASGNRKAPEAALAAGVAFMQAVERTASARIKPLPLNIDGVLAAVLHDLRFPPMFGPFIFILGRLAGLTAQVTEEYTREKPMRVRIPVAYDGEPPRQ